MIRTLIFDWDGTLHDTGRLYGGSFRKAYSWLVEQKYAEKRDYRDEEVTCYLGMNARDMWNRFMPQLPQDIKNHASDIIGREMIAGIEAGHAAMYPGAEKLLDQLKTQGYEMVILSNCKRAYLNAHRTAFQLERWFTGFYCCEDFDFASKEEIFPKFRASHPEAYVVIGDRDSDLRVATTHNLLSIGCAYGFGGVGELAAATRIAHSLSDIPKQLALLQSR